MFLEKFPYRVKFYTKCAKGFAGYGKILHRAWIYLKIHMPFSDGSSSWNSYV